MDYNTLISKIETIKKYYTDQKTKAEDSLDVYGANCAIIAINECMSYIVGFHLEDLKKNLEDFTKKAEKSEPKEPVYIQSNPNELPIVWEDFTPVAQREILDFYDLEDETELNTFMPLTYIYKEER